MLCTYDGGSGHTYSSGLHIPVTIKVKDCYAVTQIMDTFLSVASLSKCEFMREDAHELAYDLQ